MLKKPKMRNIALLQETPSSFCRIILSFSKSVVKSVERGKGRERETGNMTFDYRRTIAEVGVVCVGRGRYKRRQKGNCCKRLRGEGEGEEEGR